MRNVITTVGLLSLALVPLMAAVSPEAATMFEAMPAGQLPVAMAQPLMSGHTLAVMPIQTGSNPLLSESGLLVLVGSALLGLAAVVRRTTN